MSLTLKQILEKQASFDKNTSIKNRPFYTKINKDNMSELEHLLVCLIGEVGEFCNITKKITRGDLNLDNVKQELDEELVDCFIYLIKIANQFDVDLESGFMNKLEKNKKRFNNESF